VTDAPAPLLFLFDVDLTLVDTGGAGRRAMDRAFEEVLGVARAFDGFHFFGKVDQAILQEVHARRLARALDDETAARIRDVYLRCLAEEVAVTPRYRVLPGVAELLAALAARPDCRLGLATGNFEEGARIKLRPGGLWEAFATGGFGADAADRAELTRIGIRRLLAGAPRPPRGRVVVVGDTPNDVLAAHANGAASVAVATGGYTSAQLAAYRPAVLVEDLAGWQEWLPTLGV
jgi:phosphoglycolate phosphatase-like HAD superfamily hydrolase